MAEQEQTENPGTSLESVMEGVVVSEDGTEANVEQYRPASQAWDQVDEFDRIEGFDLEKDKMELIGVPFVITRVTYREGAFKAKGEVIPTEYVSIELVTAPKNVYDQRVPKNRRRYAEFGLPMESEIGPNEEIVINDSSTGIKRQIGWYLHSRGKIVIDEKLPQNYSTMTGASGENVFDIDPPAWDKGFDEARAGIDLRLLCKRGLRFSKYENDFAQDATTFYLA